MRILVLTKRQYTSKDLLDDRYGRLFEIPASLAQLGHEVRGVAISYRKRPSGIYEWSDIPGVHWHSFNAFPFGLIRYTATICAILDGWRPDIIWASSDMLNIILAARWANKFKIPVVLDLYDNYESFGASQIPGLKRFFRRSCRTANGITVVSKALADYVKSEYQVHNKIQIIGNGIRHDLFYPRDKIKSRADLGLPKNATIIGTAGAITTGRGISDLFEAFLLLARDREDLWLVHAGITDDTPQNYIHPRIIDLGILPFDLVPKLICSLDVAIICNRNSQFGKYCFPLKLQEAIACGVPIVAAGVGDVVDMLKHQPDSLYSPNNIEQLSTNITHQLDSPQRIDPRTISSWHESAMNLDSLLKELTEPIK